MSSKTIGDVMTQDPVSIAAETSLADAAERMHQLGVRHLPVVDLDRVVGLISERDVAVILGIPGVDAHNVAVTEAMSPHPYVVGRTAPLVEVVATMHERKLGTAVVVDAGELVGIFSVVDALGVLLGLLRGEA